MTVYLVLVLVQVSVIVGASLVCLNLLRSRSAATRHWILVASLFSAVTVGPLWLAAGPLLPASWPSMPARAFRSAVAPAVATAPAADVLDASDKAVETTWTVADHDRSSASVVATVLLSGWIIGAVTAFTVLMAGLARLRWLTARSATLTDGPWRRLADAVARRYRLSTPVQLSQSRHPTLLATWGIRRPVVLLPAGAESWSEERIDIVLAHELAHVARRDWVTLVVASFVRTVFWFHPLFWIAAQRLRIESELACDDHVLAHGTNGADYAAHLLALARLLRGDRQRWLPMVPMTRTSHLQERIRAMLVPTIDRRPISSTARASSLILVLGFTVMVAAAAAQPSFHTLSGTVRDATDRVLPDARLVLTNPVNRSKYEVRSDGSGHYEFVGLPAATYQLVADVAGFQPFAAELALSAANVRDIQLQVGTLEETLSVRGTTGPVPDVATRENARRRFEELRTRALDFCADPGRNRQVGGNIMPPKKLLDVRPLYPQHLRQAGIGGIVTMMATIGTDGFVSDIQELKGPNPELEAAAEAAVRQWQFSQTWLNCEAIDVKMRVTTNFSTP